MKDKIFSTFSTIIEWYDFALFGFLTQIFAKNFFPNSDNINNFIQLFSIFAIGFIARPIGSIIFGFIGDKFSRVLALKYTPILMGLLTCLIGFIPDYNKIGKISALLLLIIRFLQGIVIGGDFTGNIIYLCEFSKKHKYLLGGIGSISGSFGIALASFVSSIIYLNDKNEYLWRYAFIICLPLGFISFYFRKKINENDFFSKIKKANNPIIDVIKNQKKHLFIGIGILISHSCSFYFFYVFNPFYLSKISSKNNFINYSNNTILILIHICSIFLFSYVSDKYGCKKLLLISFITQILSGILVFFCYIEYYSDFYIISMLFLTAINSSSIPTFISNILPPETRYTNFSLIYSFGFGFFGGCVPVISMMLSNISHNISSLILIIPGIISFISLCFFINKVSIFYNGDFNERIH